MEFLKSPLGNDPIIVEAYYAAPPQKVFQAWTEPEKVKQWFGMKPNSLALAEIDLRVGGRWKFLKHGDEEKNSGFEGEYLAIENNQRLMFSWSFITEYKDGRKESSPKSQVEVSFIVDEPGTTLKVIHSAMHSKQACEGFGKGWNSAFGLLQLLLK